jgi:hypothetical protein
MRAHSFGDRLDVYPYTFGTCSVHLELKSTQCDHCTQYLSLNDLCKDPQYCILKRLQRLFNDRILGAVAVVWYKGQHVNALRCAPGQERVLKVCVRVYLRNCSICGYRMMSTAECGCVNGCKTMILAATAMTTSMTAWMDCIEHVLARRDYHNSSSPSSNGSGSNSKWRSAMKLLTSPSGGAATAAPPPSSTKSYGGGASAA